MGRFILPSLHDPKSMEGLRFDDGRDGTVDEIIMKESDGSQLFHTRPGIHWNRNGTMPEQNCRDVESIS